jgi:hypothetical protein
MTQSFTPKLYFGKFTDCIRFTIMRKDADVRSDPIIRNIKSIIANSGADNRTRLDWNFVKDKKVLATLNCYFTDQQLGNLLKSSLYAHLITDAVAPASELHRRLLLEGVEIQLRDRLMYNRFRYKIQFKSGFDRSNLPIIRDWVKDQFQGKKNGRKGDYLLMGNWMMCLYMSSEDDLFLLKLSLDEYIYSITRVDTFAEHGLPGS